MDNSRETQSMPIILLVEDNPVQLTYLKLLLEKHRYVVLTATNGVQALDVLKQHMPDVVISDIQMPEMNGYEFCSNLRETPQFKTLPVIFITGLSANENVILALQSGANYLMSKPYEDNNILKTINHVLQLKKLRQNKQNEFESTYVLLNGKEYTIKSDINQVLDLLMSTYDIAKQKNKELLQQKIELIEVNAYFNDKLDNQVKRLKVAGVGSWSWKCNTDYLEWDDSIHTVFGFADKHSLPRKYSDFINLVYSEDRKNYFHQLEKTLSKENYFTHEYRIVWPDETRHLVLEQGIVSRDQEGKPVELVGMCMVNRLKHC